MTAIEKVFAKPLHTFSLSRANIHPTATSSFSLYAVDDAFFLKRGGGDGLPYTLVRQRIFRR